MKIIALIPAKNEGVLLPMCLESLLNVADEVIVYDDHSTDDTVIVAQKYGAVVISENYTSEAGWPEYEIRERLLLEARSRNATHILSLDAVAVNDMLNLTLPVGEVGINIDEIE